MINESEKIGAVMVVGSGIAGIQASLDLANSGMKVYLVEKDISIGGIGIIGYTPDVPLQPGTVYENCSLSLPGFGLVVTSLQVRSSFDFMLRSGVHTQRAGCRFLDLSPQTESLIQRYILEQERKYRSRLVDDAR